MAKGKGKKGKKEKEEAPPDPNAVTEVDKTFYELQITDLNRKLSRLRELTATLEEKNNDLEVKYNQLDEDRSDVIAYLKRQLNEKQNEATELQDRLVALQEEKDLEAERFEQKVKDMDEEYKTMKEQLTSEIKLITGKLNALEEFRIHRDDLMKKFMEQEEAVEEQEIRHKRTLYEAEKLYIMSKDTIKRDMEKRILQLAEDFQAANEVRIAATTHRVIRENIAVNNEMDRLVEVIERITAENGVLKDRNKFLRQNNDLFVSERDKALSDANLQKGVIDQLRIKYTTLAEDLDKYKDDIERARVCQQDLQTTKQGVTLLNHKIRVLEQNLHATKCQEFAARDLLKQSQTKANQLKEVLFEAIDAIEEALQIQPGEDESVRYAARETLLQRLLNLIVEGKRQAVRSESMDTIETIAATYIRGDLGFTPRVAVDRPAPVLKYNFEMQVGRSLEDVQPVKQSQKSFTSIQASELLSEMSYASRTTASQYKAFTGEDQDAFVSSSSSSSSKTVSALVAAESGSVSFKESLTEVIKASDTQASRAEEEEGDEEENMYDDEYLTAEFAPEESDRDTN